jgi:hypothetical protein
MDLWTHDAVAGGRAAGTASSFAERQWRGHEVSILMALVGAVG